MKFENNWESLNTRPVPQWFEDAKFGIFIHWGLYSVPGYAPKGDYAEWYGYAYDLENPNERQLKYKEFHRQKYGEGFRYADFAAGFKAELFDAQSWAELFSRSGAKYINFVTKHHDGFCMYPTEYAWNWNSFDIGPHRDFCAELKTAMENSGVRFGIYHSVYEWNHPLYRKDPERYALEHLIPMLKELVTRYEPNTLFTDGEWEHPSSVWHSTEFLQWLYNESPTCDFIVPNDRWGSETRGRLGGNFTTEYGTIDGKNTKMADRRVAEECRGIGSSFGINRIEDTDDYLSAGKLIRILTEQISRGNNLLLNIGPSADGTIPVIMQERLLQLGRWLSINGEAVYGSRRYTDNNGNGVSYTKNVNKIYAFLDKYPWGEVTLDEVPYREGMRACLLGCSEKIAVQNENGHAKLVFPPLNPHSMEAHEIYVVRLD